MSDSSLCQEHREFSVNLKSVKNRYEAEIGSIDKCASYKKLIAFAGIDPSVYQSDQYEGEGRISKHGDRHLRKIIWINWFWSQQKTGWVFEIRKKRLMKCTLVLCNLLFLLERATGFEPATFSLGSWHSTTELHPHFKELGLIITYAPVILQ